MIYFTQLKYFSICKYNKSIQKCTGLGLVIVNFKNMQKNLQFFINKIEKIEIKN